MNQSKAKALRRAAKSIAQQSEAHRTSRATYNTVVRRFVERRVVSVKESTLGKIGRWLRGKKAPPRTKTVEVVHKESHQTVIVSGWRFVQQRLKAAVRRKEARLVQGSIVPYNTTRASLRAQLGVGA